MEVIEHALTPRPLAHAVSEERVIVVRVVLQCGAVPRSKEREREQERINYRHDTKSCTHDSLEFAALLTLQMQCKQTNSRGCFGAKALVQRFLLCKNDGV